jgi:urea carboxylase
VKTRYSFGADEHLFVECDESMSLEVFFKSLSMTNAVRESRTAGVTEICPSNASFQIKFDPDVIKPDDLLREVQAIERAAEKSAPVINTRIVEIPVYYQDPWTHETLMRFRERHQDPKSTDLEYAAHVNGLADADAFIAAHSGSPWFVSMVGFVAGLPFMYQMVDRPRQLQVPKYLRRLFLLHLFGARRRWLPNVRHHADADFRCRAEDQLSARFHGVLPPGRHREVQIDRP